MTTSSGVDIRAPAPLTSISEQQQSKPSAKPPEGQSEYTQLVEPRSWEPGSGKEMYYQHAEGKGGGGVQCDQNSGQSALNVHWRD